MAPSSLDDTLEAKTYLDDTENDVRASYNFSDANNISNKTCEGAVI